MARNEIELRHYLNEQAERVDHHTSKFGAHKDALENIFIELQAFRDDEDTPSETVTALIAKIAQGKIIIQNMLDGII